jgi:lysozyme
MITGYDVSYWQGIIDFQKMESAGANFVYIKATQNNFKDAKFLNNKELVKDVGLPFGFYHFFDLRDGSLDAKGQASYFCEQIKNTGFTLPPVMDFESPGINGYPDLPVGDSARNIVMTFFDAVYQNLGVYPMLYTNLSGLNALYPIPNWLKSKLLWLAYYSNNEPDMSKYGWNYKFWQYGLGKGNGEKYGVSSKDIDSNLFKGTKEELLSLMEVNIAEENFIYEYSVTATLGLNVRNKSNTSGQVVDKLVYNSKVHVYEITDGWGKIDVNNDKWCSMQYLQKTGNYIVQETEDIPEEIEYTDKEKLDILWKLYLDNKPIV